MLDAGIRVTAGEEPPDGAAYEVLVAGVPDRKLVEASGALRMLVIPWSGIPKRTRNLMREFPAVAVHNLHHNADQVAEMALALLLAAAKRVVPLDAALRRGDWSARYDDESPVVLLRGRRALVLGYGALGRFTAELLAGIGMRVTAVRRSGNDGEGSGDTALKPVSDLPELLPTADAVLVCLPATEETVGMIGARELAALPERAILVNVGRGPVVDEKALYEALRSGTLHAAGIDVWYNYPKDEPGRADTQPSDFPFHELDNVVMSPHRAGAPNTPETETMRMKALAELLNLAARGRRIPNRVDLELGY